MSRTRWWWIRHAPVTENNGTIYGDADLNCDCSNLEAFTALAHRLPEQAIWVTTPLLRTRQTAEALFKQKAFLPEPSYYEVREFQEQSFGEWQGMTHKELGEKRNKAWHRFWLAPASEAPPGGESFLDLLLRTDKAIDRLNHDHQGQDIVVIAHGGTIRAAVAKALDLSPEKALGLAIDNLSLTQLDYYTAENDPFTDQSSWGVGCLNAAPLAFNFNQTS
ncbi:histidine phosphatase family protein [Kiloniella laminariae]|uniref:Histidine phosphatase family protein n=1 Tax=Kiloniella laminariae TaxID=454162 RepID=A0ABT4LIM8_9PROT|nr:histidine phosphatase family protein [Kiloniella laminariae]MCZ4280961.1 histidine phosphatase family protein [Kiloniella laminariae]